LQYQQQLAAQQQAQQQALIQAYVNQMVCWILLVITDH
jgi:hypothetical protein